MIKITVTKDNEVCYETDADNAVVEINTVGDAKEIVIYQKEYISMDSNEMSAVVVDILESGD